MNQHDFYEELESLDLSHLESYFSKWDDKSVPEAREFVIIGREQGVRCPVCGQMCKVYCRRLNHICGKGLIWLCGEYRKMGSVGYVHMPTKAPKTIVSKGGEFARLKYWGLAIEKVNDETGKRCSGLWAPTQRGFDFIENRLELPSHVFLYLGKAIGFSTTQISIREALGHHFDYQELMNTHMSYLTAVGV